MPRFNFVFCTGSMLVTSMLLFFIPVEIKAQKSIPKFSHPLSQSGAPEIRASGTLEIIAVRVEFQPDDNRFTTGDGTFDGGNLAYLDDPSIHIDPLPHDRTYFESHLEFAKNYFETVSNGELEIEYRVLPDIYRVDEKMEFYSPTGVDFTNEKLALLARDAWQKVDQSGAIDTTGLDSGNIAFVIFHAGVGRDIELTGTNLDITPQDIPSIYLGESSLGELLDETSFSGFPLNGGALQVTNSLVMPRTLSRPGETVAGQQIVLQLSLNGLISAGLGSHIGLPDLFNTETGESAIGRFGLMDGAGIFSYNGLFPPEPSAWEKMHLGWTSPFLIDPVVKTQYDLPAVSLRVPNLSAGRLPLSEDEFFLVENRHRDPGNNGLVMRVRTPEGTVVEQRFENGDEEFVFQEAGFEELLPKGVVIEVDDYDWSLPGGLDRGPDGIKGSSDDRILNGGILIWHIDNTVIGRHIAANTINANPGRRGVDLEEADGAQDIGKPVEGSLTGNTNGTAFDFWWQGNNSSVITAAGDTLSLYQNRFGIDTRPSSSANSGATSFLELSGFSDNAVVAGFNAEIVDAAGITNVTLPESTLPNASVPNSTGDSFYSNYPLELSVYRAMSDTFLIIPTSQTVFALQLNAPVNALFNLQTPPPQQPYLGSDVVVGSRPGNAGISLSAYRWDGLGWQNIWNNSGSANRGFLSSLDDQVLLLDLTDDRFDLNDGTQLADLESARIETVPVSGTSAILTTDQLNTGNRVVPVSDDPDRLYAGVLQLTQDMDAFYLLDSRSFSLIRPQESDPEELLFSSLQGLEWPAFADFDRDGRTDVLYVDKSDRKVKAVGSNGAMLDSFPFEAKDNGTVFIGTPLVADIEGDGKLDILITAQDSISMNIHAYDSAGKLKEGFPLFVGSVISAENQPVHPVLDGETLYAVSHSGDIKAWRFPGMTDILWKGRYGNEPFNKVTGRVTGDRPPSTVPSILVDSETYNWPNPARDETYLRYQTSGPGTVEVKIITVSGRIIFEENYTAAGGAPEEQRIDTSVWGSGIYLAKITAEVNGRESSKLIKIAVVH